MAAIETPITELTPVYTDPAVLQGKAVLVHDPTTGDGIVFDASKLDPSEKYQKPSTGIPKTDLAEVVQESLEKANTALQPEDIAQEKGTDEEKVMSQKAVTGIFTELQLKSGVAEGLADTLSAGTAQEITFRKSGGDGVNYMKAIKGKTLAWNQLVQMSAGPFTRNGITMTVGQNGKFYLNGTASADIVQTDYFAPAQTNIQTGHRVYISGFTGNGKVSLVYIGQNYGGAFNTISSEAISTPTHGIRYFSLIIPAGTSFANEEFSFPFIADLTLMFGANNEPSTVEEFEAMFPEAYYPYNAGTPISNDAEALETGGFNQIDLSGCEFGTYNQTTGALVDNTSVVRCRMPVVGGSSYYIKMGTNLRQDSNGIGWYDSNLNYLGGANYNVNPVVAPSSAAYGLVVLRAVSGTITLEMVRTSGLCINLSDASKNGTYEPYWKRIINLNLSTLKDKDGNLVFPYGGMNGVGTAFDVLKPDADGMIRVGTRVFGRVDLGELAWTLSYGGTMAASISAKGPGESSLLANIVCSKYTLDSVNKITTAAHKDKTIGINGVGNTIYVYDSAYTDAAAFKAAMAGVYAYYELATPVEFELAEPIPNSILVDELGTERAIFPTHEDGSPSAPLCTDSNYSISVKNLVAAIKNLNQA